MLNYAVDPECLCPLLPAGVELDSFDGVTYASIVAFRFLNTRVRGLGIPFHRDFDEINLRFYVRRQAEDGQWRRGVVFVKEIVPRLAIAMVARLFYNENYVAMPTRHHLGANETGLFVDYGWRFKGHWNELKFQSTGLPKMADPGSLEEFITEHYWGYAAQPDGGCVEYQVEHPRWRIWQPKTATLDCDVGILYGAEIASHFRAAPRSAFLAEGSPVKVLPGRRLT